MSVESSRLYHCWEFSPEPQWNGDSSIATGLLANTQKEHGHS